MGTGVLSKGLPGLQSEVRFNISKVACKRCGNSHGRLQIAVELTVRRCTFSLSHCHDPCQRLRANSARMQCEANSTCEHVAPLRKRQGGFRRAGVILADAGYGAYPPRCSVVPLVPCSHCSALPSRWDLSETRRVLVVNLVASEVGPAVLTDNRTLTLHDARGHAGQ